MGLIKTLGRYAWRKFALDGVSSSGFHEPEHRDIFAFVDKVDELTAALAAAGSLKGEWDASSGVFPGGGVTAKGDTWLVTEAGTTGGRFFAEGDRIVALVVNASTSVFGVNWGVIPANARTVVAGVDEGAGTANAIQVTTEDAVADGTLLTFTLFRDTTGSPVTIAVDGGTPYTLKTNRGNSVSALTENQFICAQLRADNTAWLLIDQDVSALVGQAEDAQAAAEAAAAAALASAAGVDLPPVAANTMLVDNAAGDARETKTFAEVKALWDPDEQILRGEGLKLAYHKARGALPIKAFGTSLTEVGGGSAAVDTVALQNAMDSGEIIDVTGAQLKVSDVIVCNVQSSKIGASIASHRPALTGSPNSQISVDDNELPVVFQVGHDNFEACCFNIHGLPGNVTTSAFHFERTVDTYRDIDARLLGMCIHNMGRAAYHKGRGLETDGLTVADLAIATFELDQPATWTPRGSASIDGIDTGSRGYRFNNTRVHATQSPFIKNTGTYALNIGGIEINGMIADIGANTGLLNGVLIDLMAQGLQCRFAAAAGSRLLELAPGSRNVNVTNFNCAGYIGASGNRLSNHAMRMVSSAANPIRDVFISNGTIGPTLQDGAVLTGDGAFDNIVFSSVIWQNIGQDGGERSPIKIEANVISSMIKLIGTHARSNFTSRPFLRAFNTPANNTLYRELTATIDGSFSAWATSGVVQPPY